jgi:hypothetical protein
MQSREQEGAPTATPNAWRVLRTLFLFFAAGCSLLLTSYDALQLLVLVLLLCTSSESPPAYNNHFRPSANAATPYIETSKDELYRTFVVASTCF